MTIKTYQDIQGWYDWKPLIQRLIKERFPLFGGVYIEVGVWKGKSIIDFWHMAKEAGATNSQIIGVDLFCGKQDDENMDAMVARSGNFFEETQKNCHDCGAAPTLVEGDSTESAKLFDNESAHIILIDALHTYDAVKRDTLAWLPKLESGGVMLWHDADREPVRKAITECVGRNWKIEQPRTAYWVKP